MIKVERPRRPPPILSGDTVEKKRQDAWRDPVKHQVSRYVYGHVDVKNALRTLYHGKCAYCERLIDRDGYLTVDHYRPKSRPEEERDHLGYYWLIYEWTNLLPSCQICNTQKSNSFPIRGRRLFSACEDPKTWHVSSTELTNEDPLIIHPEVMDIHSLIGFSSDGYMVAREDPQVAMTTIQVLDLNRNALVVDRKRILDDWVADVKERLESIFLYLKFSVLPPEVKFDQAVDQLCRRFQKLQDMGEPHQPFSAFASQMMDQLEELIGAQFEDRDKAQLLQSLKRYRNRTAH